MRPLPRPRIALVFVAIMVALWIAHDPPDPTTSRALKDTAQRLREYYRETPPPESWRVHTVAVHGAEVWVDLSLPADRAEALADESFSVIADVLRPLCAPPSDVAWRLLRPKQEIQVRGLAADGSVLAAVNCRTAPR